MTWMLRSRHSTLVHSEKARRLAALLLALLLLGAVALGPAPAQASLGAVTFAVNSTLDEPDATPGDGSCASTPSGLCTLRAAVQEANALAGSDSIALPAGIYTLNISGRGEDLAVTGDLDLRESVTIQGTDSSATIINANATDRAFQIFSPAVVSISDLTIQGGDSGSGLGASGGGIALASGSQLTLQDVTLSGNSAGDTGGGLYNNGGALILRRVRVVANNAATAAGIRNSGSLSIYDSTIADNHATQTGGGILNTGALTLEAVTVSGNIADTNGGGLYLHSADPVTGLVSILNSTINGNQARAYMGGGIWVYYQTELWVSSSTVANNTAGQGGGIFNYHQQGVVLLPNELAPDNVAQEGNVHLHNTIVANNAFANCGRSAQTFIIDSVGHNLDSGTTCEFSQPTDQTNTDPQLLALGDNGGPTATQALSPGSPAIDTGDNVDCPATDQRGRSRPQGSACDIGAYEANPAGEANLTIQKVASPDPVFASAPLTYTLSINNSGPSTATAITVTDQLPPEVTYGDVSGVGWNCGHGGGTVTCTRASLAVGVAPDIVINVTAPGHSGLITNTAVVSSQVVDSQPNNNSARITTQIRLVHYVYLPLVLK